MRQLPIYNQESPSSETQLRILRSTARQATESGQQAVTVFLQAPRLNNTIERPITSTLYPRDSINGKPDGYLFEISSQLGCVVGCDFCGCDDIVGSLHPSEVVDQIQILQNSARQFGIENHESNFISFTDGGELFLNPECPEILSAVYNYMPADIKVSSVLPVNLVSQANISYLLDFMENCDHSIRLQVSLYSTDETLRNNSARVPLMSFSELRVLGEQFMSRHPNGRKITLTFTLTEDTHCVPQEILECLPPDTFVIRLHPFKENNLGTGLNTISDDNCRRLAKEFEALGYHTICQIYNPHEIDQLISGGSRSHINNLLSHE